MMETADHMFSETHPSLLSLPSSGTKLTLFAHSPWMPRSIHTQRCEEHYQQIGKSSLQDTCTQKGTRETTHFSRRARSTSAVRLYYTSQGTGRNAPRATIPVSLMLQEYYSQYFWYCLLTIHLYCFTYTLHINNSMIPL